MKLYATLKNDRGGKKSSGDDTRLLIELSYKNKIVGTVGLYSVNDNEEDLGYRVVWSDERGFDPNRPPIREEIKKPEGYNSNKDTLLCVKRGCGKPQCEDCEYCEEHA